VLSVSPESCEGLDDPLLAESVASGIDVARVSAWDEERCRKLGFRHLAYRSLAPLYRQGCRILEHEHHDVIFFSTTVFLSFALGPLWKRRFGSRVVYDFQDPWYSPRPPYTTATVPGTWWKYRLDQWWARYLEAFSLKHADHIITVSDSYAHDLMRRYAWLKASDFTVLPFGAATDDYEFVHRRGVSHSVFEPASGLTNWVYAGAVVDAMNPVLDVFLGSVAELAVAAPEFADRLRLHFVGTNYAPAARTSKRIETLVRRHGLQNVVMERSERLPYFQTLALYEDSEALLLFGSASAGYTPSKLFNCVLSKRPILAMFHRRSLAAKIAPQFPNVFLATFGDSPSEPGFAAQVAAGIAWLRAPNFEASAIEPRLAPWSAAELTRTQCAIFDRVCGPAAGRS
jgi:glycosyltransferase involved in cell wall biosynthesis